MTTGSPQPPESVERAQKQSSERVRLWLLVLAVIVLGGIVDVIIYGYLERPGWIGVSGKQFWDYLELLIVPAALALGVFWLNRSQNKRDQQAEEERDRRNREAEAAQVQQALRLEEERAQEAAVQAYLDQLTLLLVRQHDGGLIRVEVDEGVLQVIQARSEPLLRSVSATRRWNLILFLSVMGLLARDRPLVSLAGADLEGVDGSRAPLQYVDLQGANLKRANLTDADLIRANLSEADLTGAMLLGARLSGADLRKSKLSEAFLTSADLSNANLREANLSGLSDEVLKIAGLSGAQLFVASANKPDLRQTGLSWDQVKDTFPVRNGKGALLVGTNLKGADLTDAAVSILQLRSSDLEGATMPDGQKYEDWLKSKDNEENG